MAADYPERFAAIAPICRPPCPFKPGILDKLPIWCLHRDMDNVVPVEDADLVARRLREYGGQVRFTVYSDAGHDSWNHTCDDAKLYESFLRHMRGPCLTD